MTSWIIRAGGRNMDREQDFLESGSVGIYFDSVWYPSDQRTVFRIEEPRQVVRGQPDAGAECCGTPIAHGADWDD